MLESQPEISHQANDRVESDAEWLEDILRLARAEVLFRGLKPTMSSVSSQSESPTDKETIVPKSAFESTGGEQTEVNTTTETTAINVKIAPASQLLRSARRYLDQTPGITIRSGSFGLKQRKGTQRSKTSFNGSDLLGDYFRKIAKYEVLTQEQEIELAQRIRTGREATLKLFLDGFRSVYGMNSMYSPEEKDILAIRDGLEAKDHFLHANLRLVVSFAKRYQNLGLDFEELVQECNLGLEHAIDLFDEQRGFKFSTYGVFWIRQAASRALDSKSRMIRLPSHMEDFSDEIMELYNNGASFDEIAENIGLRKDTIMGIVTSVQSTQSTDDLVGQEQETRLGDLIADNNSSYGFDLIDNDIIRSKILDVLGQLLDERETKIIAQRYRIDGSDSKLRTLDEVAKQFSLTRERIRQIEKRALSKLRHPAAHKILSQIDTN